MPGFVGSHLIEHLFKNTDWHITCLDRLDISGDLERTDELLRAFPEYRSRFDFVYYDLKAPITSEVASRLNNPNLIFHLAASSHVDRSISDPLLFVMDNVVGTCNILNYARQVDCLEYFQNFSTDEVFGDANEGEEYLEWDRHKPGNPYCLHPLTKVRSDNGLVVSIKDLNIGDKVLSWNLKSNLIEPKKIIEKINSKINQKYTIKLHRNKSDIICSENHKFLVKRPARYINGQLKDTVDLSKVELKELIAQELQVGDWIPVARKVPTTPDVSKLERTYYNTESIQFLGYFAGDGNIKKSYSRQYDKTQYTICLADEKRDFIDYYRRILPSSNQGYIFKHKTKNCWYLQLGDIALVKYLQSLPISNKTKKIDIPDFIIDGTSDMIFAFVSGYLDADGCFTNGKFEFCSYSNSFLRNLQLILRKVGVIGSICYKNHKVTVSDSKSCKTLSKNLIGLKGGDINNTNKIQQTMSDDNIVWYPITSIKVEDSEEEYIDITVEDNENFLIEEFVITHNSASKSGADQLCTAFHKTYGLPIVNTNCMNIIGEKQHVEKFLPMCIRKILLGEKIYIHSYPGKQKSGTRFYVHARNVADACLFLTNKGKKGERYNLVGQEEISNLELAERIANIIGKPLVYEMVDFHSNRPGHDLRYALDGLEMANLGYDYPISFDESLERTVRWTLNNKKWIGL